MRVPFLLLVRAAGSCCWVLPDGLVAGAGRYPLTRDGTNEPGRVGEVARETHGAAENAMRCGDDSGQDVA
jgi:hypothetical protein